MTSTPLHLTTEEQQRYLRQILLSEVGVSGQEKLKNASVLCVGAGGLASPALLYLAAAGIGRIGIIDADTVSTDNLQRQILYSTSDVGRLKTDSAKETILKLNPFVQVETFNEAFSAVNAEKILSRFEAVIDATDNFAARYLINDAAIKLDKPVFFGSIFKFSGQVAVFSRDTGCYRCIFPAPPAPELAPDCSVAGVLGVLPGIVGSYQAVEFLKWKLGIGELLKGKLLTIDVLTHQSRILEFHRSSDCAACAAPDKIVLRETVAAPASFPGSVSVSLVKSAITNKENIFLLDVREEAERRLGHIGGTFVPLAKLSAASPLPKDPHQKIIAYCRSGARSARAAEVLKSLGYKNVYNLEGGLIAWKNEIDPSLKI